MSYESRTSKHSKPDERELPTSSSSANANQPGPQAPLLERRSPMVEEYTSSVPPVASSRVVESVPPPLHYLESDREGLEEIGPSVDIPVLYESAPSAPTSPLREWELGREEPLAAEIGLSVDSPMAYEPVLRRSPPTSPLHHWESGHEGPVEIYPSVDSPMVYEPVHFLPHREEPLVAEIGPSVDTPTVYESVSRRSPPTSPLHHWESGHEGTVEIYPSVDSPMVYEPAHFPPPSLLRDWESDREEPLVAEIGPSVDTPTAYESVSRRSPPTSPLHHWERGHEGPVEIDPSVDRPMLYEPARFPPTPLLRHWEESREEPAEIVPLSVAVGTLMDYEPVPRHSPPTSLHRHWQLGRGGPDEIGPSVDIPMVPESAPAPTSPHGHWHEEPVYTGPSVTTTGVGESIVPLFGTSLRHGEPIYDVPPAAVMGDRPAPPPLGRRSPRHNEATYIVPPVDTARVGESVPSPHSRWESGHEGPAYIGPSVEIPMVYASASPPSRTPEGPTYEVPPVPINLSSPDLDLDVIDVILPEPINNKINMSAIKDSLASLKDATVLAGRISYISPVAGHLLEALTVQNEEVKQHKEQWDVVQDKLEKVASLVSDVGTMCRNKDLGENDLPRSLHAIFQTLETELGLIKHAIKQSNEMGVIKKVFLDSYMRRKVEVYDDNISNVLQSFQAALAFNPDFVEFAKRIEVEVTNVNARYDEDQTPLHVASQLEHIHAMHSLIERGANLNAENEDKETPLFLVSRNGNEKATQLLLNRHVDINHQDWERRTPLHWASEKGHHRVAKLLLKFHADSNAKNMYHWTPLHLASRTGERSVAKALLRWGADVNARNDFGWTPLHMASQKGHLGVVELLLCNNAEVDIQEAARHETALHLAAYYGHVAVASLLISHGANLRKQNKESMTPLSLAIRANHEDVTRLLEAHGRDSARERTTITSVFIPTDIPAPSMPMSTSA